MDPQFLDRGTMDNPVETDASPGALVLATFALAVAFASWSLFAVVGVDIKNALDLNETRFGILLATPMLFGALMCIPLGTLAERWGGKNVILFCLLALCPFLIWLSLAETYGGFLIAGAGLGLAAGLFGAGLPYVAAFSRTGREGFSLGVFASGMLGVGLTYLMVPMTAQAYGWRVAPLVYVGLVLVVAMLVWLLADNDAALRRQTRTSLGTQLGVLMQIQVWRFCLYYSFIFGGFVALALWLPDYLSAHYGLSLKTAAMLSLMFTIPGALTQIVGGLLADLSGARQVNWLVFWVCLVCLFFLSYPPTTMVVHGIEQDLHITLYMPLPLFMALILVLGTAMGFGKGSILRMVFNYYPDRIGVVGGTIVAFGGLGGFVLPILFGLANDWIGVRSASFMMLYGLLAVCMLVMFLGARHEEHRRRLERARSDQFLKMTTPLTRVASTRKS